MKTRLPNWARATLALLVGSTVAALVHISIGFVAPPGFQDLRHTSASNAMLAFGTAWFFSALITVPLGGLAWRPLHRLAYDGFISYSVVAVVGYLILHVAVGLREFSFVVMGSALGNAAGIRCIERILTAMDQSADTASTKD